MSTVLQIQLSVVSLPVGLSVCLPAGLPATLFVCLFVFCLPTWKMVT